MIGVACAAQTRGWTGLPSVLAPCLRRRWPAGPPPSARPHAALSRVGQAVALWGLHNGTSQHLPQPSPPMAGALGRWGMRAWTARLACTAPIQGMARPHAGRAGRLGPCPHAPQTRGKRPCARGVRRLPPPACGPEPTRRLVLGWREHGWGATPGAHPGAPGSGGPGPATRLAGRARPRSGPSPAPPPPPRPARRWPTRPPRCPRLSGGRPGPRRLPRSRRARRGGRGPPARPATRSGVPRPPGPGGLARGAGPSCRRDGSAPARGPGAPRPAPRGPPRAPWPHRAQASAARPTRGRRLGAAPSWTAGPRRGRWARPDDRAPDACGAPAWRCARGLCKTETAARLAPGTRVRHPRGTRPGASLTPVCRRGSRRATTRRRRRGQGEADRPVSCVGRLGSRGQACLEVRRGGGCLNPTISPAGAACNPTSDHQQNPLQPDIRVIGNVWHTRNQRMAVETTDVSHKSPLSMSRHNHAPTLPYYRGGEKNTMLSVAGLCRPTSGELLREAAQSGARSQYWGVRTQGGTQM